MAIYIKAAGRDQWWEIQSLSACPAGGGFAMSWEREAVQEYFKDGAQIVTKLPAARVHTMFSIDGRFRINGWHNPDVRWNGWACPSCTLAEFVDMCSREGISYKVHTDEHGSKHLHVWDLLTSTEEEPEGVFSLDDRGAVHLGFQWCWEVDEDE